VHEKIGNIYADDIEDIWNTDKTLEVIRNRASFS